MHTAHDTGVIIRVWTITAHLTLTTVISIALAYLIVWFLAGEGEVFTAADVRPQTIVAKPGGAISYVYNQHRHESCPGEVIQIFVKGAGRDAVIRETRRPVQFTDVRTYTDLRISVAVPADLPPGRYHYRDGIESRCPTYRRYDPIAEFDVEITE